MSLLWQLFTILVITSSTIAIELHSTELEFVTVVFRHGDRAPDNNGKEIYPNDPYRNFTFYPMGLGGLTNSGKLREYHLGKELRQRYGDFLGTNYLTTDIIARSTDYVRTKQSLLLVLASLYPPSEKQTWNPRLNWQPIPITYVLESQDNLLIPEECPRYLAELERMKSEPEVIEKVEKFRPLMKNLTKLTGKLINNTNDMWYLYHNLMAEYSMNLTLPKWTKGLFPEGPLLDAAVLEYEVVSYNDELKKLNGGALLKRITDDFYKAIFNWPREAQKMNLFSGHETNIAALLQVLGIGVDHVPAYSSSVFVELRRAVDRYFVQVLYYRGIPNVVEVKQIPGCDELCPIDDFLQLLKNVTPSDEEMVCPKS